MTYNGLIYTGFRAVEARFTRPTLNPTSGAMTARARNSTAICNSTSISSLGQIFKFKSFAFGCEAYNTPHPVACSLNITGFTPGQNGLPDEMMQSLSLSYVPAPAGPVDTGDSDMMTVDEDVLAGSGLANYYVFETRPGGAGEEGNPRLMLDNVDAVYYEQFLGVDEQ